MSHTYDPTCGCRHCDPTCPRCDAPIRNFHEDCCDTCGFHFTTSARERGDDDGVEYADPRDYLNGLE